MLDHGSGNLRSAQRALERVGAEVAVTADHAAAEAADGLVLPGVGAYAACMAGLRAVNAPRVVGRRLAGGRPVLGICVGMQVLFEAGDEHGVRTRRASASGPAWSSGCDAPVLPHMGWNTVDGRVGVRAVSPASRTRTSTSSTRTPRAGSRSRSRSRSPHRW